MLKAYQQEVDAVSKRARSAEAVVLDVYKRLHDAPDPALLSSAAEKGAAAGASSEALAAENARLRGTLDDYHRYAVLLYWRALKKR